MSFDFPKNLYYNIYINKNIDCKIKFYVLLTENMGNISEIIINKVWF